MLILLLACDAPSQANFASRLWRAQPSQFCFSPAARPAKKLILLLAFGAPSQEANFASRLPRAQAAKPILLLACGAPSQFASQFCFSPAARPVSQEANFASRLRRAQSS
jgi:hypothetical protein